MHYYIDGYNLLFRLLKPGDDLKKQREQITIDLEAKTALLELDVTLVFDSHYQEGDNTRSHLHNLEIIFTAAGETADAFILQEIKEAKNPSKHTVVTSDKTLARLCRLRLAKTEEVDEFISWLNKRYKSKKRQRKAALPPTVKATPSPPPQLPQTSAPAETCFDYYLQAFEEELKLQEPTKKPPSSQAQKEERRKKPRQKSPSPQEEISDMERWQRIFENHPSEE